MINETKMEFHVQFTSLILFSIEKMLQNWK